MKKSECKGQALRRIAFMFFALAAGSAGAEWMFVTPPTVPDPAAGTASANDALSIRVPSRRSIGWWEDVRDIPDSAAFRIRARAEIRMDDASDNVLNDCTMVVTWFDPRFGSDKPRRFLQRDFVAYRDSVSEDGRVVVREYDETFATPKGCRSIKIECIAKWHPMKVAFSSLDVAPDPQFKQRLVRCVVGNPWERQVDWKDPDKAIASRLGQIEATLTNIFANVEHPDLILFSECFTDTGSPDKRRTAEHIPGGPSWNLAARYAIQHRCNIAMNVHEVTDAGTYHNTVFIADRQGKLAGVYRKCHLTSGEYQNGILPGDGFNVIKLDFGVVGALVCWDNWFSESAKFVRRAGAELLLFPLAGCAKDHIDFTWPARTIDIGIPMLVAMRQGKLPNGIIDRDGKWLSQTFEDNGYAWADIDLNARPRTFWLSVGPGLGDAYQLYLDESRPEIYMKQKYPPRK